ncbi:helix-turn-helix transcriptional regulator [Thioclava sp.]|uniref:helix-turn-helix transcriptional regulator n=1 Tax=Thioclava sp. TaxID=1933450 RepID=UPI003AA92E9B
MTHDLLAELRSAIEAQQYPQIMTPAQAADFLGVSDYYLLDLRKRKSGPAYSQPASKIVRYIRDDLIAWMNEHRVDAG